MINTSEVRQRLREHGIEHMSTRFLMGCEYGPDVPLFRISWTRRFQEIMARQFGSLEAVEEYLTGMFPELQLRQSYAEHPDVFSFIFIQPVWKGIR